MLTKKDVLRLGRNVYSVGYCKAQYLLNYSRKVGYNVGIRGYNYDVYIVGDDVIITGCRPFKCKKIDTDLLKKYESEAREVQYKGGKNVEITVHNLLDELLKQTKNNKGGNEND